MSIYDVGDVATLDFTVKVNEVLTDADVTLTITAPGGEVETPEPVRVDVGTYTFDQPVTQAGTWRYLWAATGAATAAESGTFKGRDPNALGPTVQDVADVIPRRALDGSGLAGGTFTADTSPTAEQVQRVADRYGANMQAALGGTVPEALTDRAAAVAAVGAAAQVELSFFPETAATVSKPLFDRYDAELKLLLAEAERITGEEPPGSETGGSAGSLESSFAFPAVGDDLSRLLAGYGARPAGDPLIDGRPTYT